MVTDINDITIPIKEQPEEENSEEKIIRLEKEIVRIEGIAFALCQYIRDECGDYTDGAYEAASRALKLLGWDDNDIRLWKQGELIITDEV